MTLTSVKLLKEMTSHEKEIGNENGLRERTHRLIYYDKHCIDLCGSVIRTVKKMLGDRRKATNKTWTNWLQAVLTNHNQHMEHGTAKRTPNEQN